jgi:hypothetical protein
MASEVTLGECATRLMMREHLFKMGADLCLYHLGRNGCTNLTTAASARNTANCFFQLIQGGIIT